jgi:hypothetical protein
MIKFLKFSDGGVNDRIFFEMDQEVYHFSLVQFEKKRYYALNTIYHDATFEICSKCGDNTRITPDCKALAKDKKAILQAILESPELRLIQETGGLFDRDCYFISDAIEKHLSGMEQKIMKLHLEEFNTTREIGYMVNLSEPRVYSIMKNAYAKL